MRSRRLLVCLLLILAASFLPLARAHQVASVELEFQNLENEWRLIGEMDIAYMLPETRNVPGGLPLSREAVMKSPPGELARIRRETENTLRKLLRFSYAGKEIDWAIEYPDFTQSPFALPEEAGDIALITTWIRIPTVPGPGDLRVHWNGEQETELIILSEAGDDPKIISTLPGGNLMLLKRSTTGQSAPVERPLAGGWLLSGFRHVIPLGLDHMLFILGLFLLLPKWKPLVGQSLLFTIAHSITLALSVLGVIHFPGKWVEVLIALSIAWVGIENLLVRKLGKQRLILVFCFGLLHGLGFASVLAEKLGGIPPDQLTGPLLGFNVGVELAQIAVLCAAFLVLWPLRKWTRQVQTLGSAFIALAGIGWMVERLFFG
jgi:hydrogenase/urease accessory protein HupE